MANGHKKVSTVITNSKGELYDDRPAITNYCIVQSSDL